MIIIEVFYQVLIVLLAPLVGAVFVFFRRGRIRLFERFGFWGIRTFNPDTLWFHAASNGELRGLLPLFRKLRQQQRDLPVLLTVTSPSAIPLIDDPAITVRLAPFDALVFYRNAFGDGVPRGLVIAETEIWPGMLSFARSRGIPVIMVNARISDYTATRYRLLKRVLRPLLSAVRHVCCADTVSVERFRELGVSRISCSGNMKYDLSPSMGSSDERDQIRKRFQFGQEPLVVLGSVHPGEEQVWLRAFQVLMRQGKTLDCILAPRHLERLDYFVRALTESGIPFVRFSELTDDHTGLGRSLVLLDSFGLLEKSYSIASLAFVGGSLVDVGGHNPLEPAAYGVPVVMGPYDSTVREITAQMSDRDGFIRVMPGEDVTWLLERAHARDSRLTAQGEQARAIWLQNQGATAHVMEVLQREMGSEYRAGETGTVSGRDRIR